MKKLKEAVRRPKVASRILSKVRVEQAQSEPECDQQCLLGRLHGMITQASDFPEPWDYSRILPPPASEMQRRQSRQLYSILRPWQTRLIQLLPGEPDSFPTCRLLTVESVDMEGVGIAETSEVVTYAAISYVWGQTALDSQILCNGIWLPISKSLAKALFHLHRLGATGYYWCDAICIDQENFTERASQVTYMLRIFEKADRVIAWMGQLESKHLPLLTFINSAPEHNDQIQASIQGRRHNAQCYEALKTLQNVLSAFTKLPWFARTWIRQEVFAAKTVTLYSTESKMEFDNLYANIQHWLQVDLGKAGEEVTPKTEAVPVHGAVKMASQFSIMCSHFKHNGTDIRNWQPPACLIRHSLYWLRTLQQGTGFEVTDPRDRVYALLGVLSSPTTRLYIAPPDSGISASNEIVPDLFPVDYKKTVSQVYEDFMKYLINANKNLDCLCVFQKRRRQADDLPSWVLDWRRETHRILVDFPPDPPAAREFLGLAMSQDLKVYGVLSISGLQVGTINSIYGYERISDAIRRIPVHAWGNPSESSQFRDSSDTEDDVLHRLRNLAHLDYVQVNQSFYSEIRQGEYYPRVRECCRFYAPRESMLDDHIIFAEGAEHPLVLRNVNNDQWQFIGPAILLVVREGMLQEWAHSREPSVPLSLSFRRRELYLKHYPSWDAKSKNRQTYSLI